MCGVTRAPGPDAGDFDVVMIPDTSCAATLDAFQANAHTLGGVRGMAGHGLEECIRERKERAIRGGVGLR